MIISIHAPSRERLKTDKLVTPEEYISIHAPSRERPDYASVVEKGIKFQSTLPRGSDRKLNLVCGDCMISIHAPSRERLTLSKSCSHTSKFQSTLPRGSDFTFRSHLFTITIFQSTLPRGSDVNFIQKILARLHFNPRSLAGATYRGRQKHYCIGYFNPRSLAGATWKPGKGEVGTGFQSTLPRGSDNINRFLMLQACFISIHAPSRERPISLTAYSLLVCISIHAPSRERPPLSKITLILVQFQSTLPRGSDRLLVRG